jgi:tetratricopeptide (TPR) repeat protein
MAASPEMSQFIATHCPSSRVPGAQLYWQGMESLRIGQYEDALTKFVRSAKILQSPEAYTGAGKALIETNLPDKALECFNKAISISPTAKDAHILKGANTMVPALIQIFLIVPKCSSEPVVLQYFSISTSSCRFEEPIP